MEGELEVGQKSPDPSIKDVGTPPLWTKVVRKEKK
jgi:hypothetical protein